MFESLVKAFAEGRIYAKSYDGAYSQLSLQEHPLKFGEAGHRYKFRAKLPSGTRCEVTHDSAIAFVGKGIAAPINAAYVVLD